MLIHMQSQNQKTKTFHVGESLIMRTKIGNKLQLIYIMFVIVCHWLMPWIPNKPYYGTFHHLFSVNYCFGVTATSKEVKG